MSKKVIVVDGTIRGKQRPFFTRSGHTYTPHQTTSYENWVKLCYQNQGGEYFADSPVDIEIVAYYKVPKSYTKKKQRLIQEGLDFPVKPPDTDNIAKIIGDSLNKLAYEDDRQVVNMKIRKCWTFENERVEFAISQTEKKF